MSSMPEPSKYQVKVKCLNCKHKSKIMISEGTKVSECKCVKCQCWNTLTSKNYE